MGLSSGTAPRTDYRTATPATGGVYKIGAPYRIGLKWYFPREQPGYDETGVASWYGADFHAKTTANGEIYDMYAMTAAHPTLPLPSLVRVTNLSNGRSIVVRVNDRGPFVGDRLIDMSYAAATNLGFAQAGTTRVRVTYLGRASLERHANSSNRATF